MLTDPETLYRLAPHTFANWATGGRYRLFPHVRFIGKRIMGAVSRGRARLIVNMPPRHGKSSLISQWTPTWFLDNDPRRRVIVAAHGAELAEHWGRTVRNEFEQNRRLRARLRADSTAANRWNTSAGGGIVTAGVGTGITGFGADLVLIDDPHPTWAKAYSPAHRREVADWFGGTISDRLEPGASIVLLMHRWHEDDLAGHLMASHPDRWEVLRLPAIAEPGDPMGRRPGEALCPERYTVEDLRAAHLDAGDAVWDAKFQQNPQLVGGGRAYGKWVPADNERKGMSLRPDLPLQLAWDFNVNPGVHVIVGQYDTRADLFTAVREVHGPRMKTGPALAALDKVVAALGGWRQFPEVQVFGDRSGRTENTTTDATDYLMIGEALAAAGVKTRFRVQTANPPVKSRLTAVNEAIRDAAGQIHCLVDPVGCPRLCRDLRTVKEDADGLIDKSDGDLTHPSDALGYLIWFQRPVVPSKPSGAVPAVVTRQ